MSVGYDGTDGDTSGGRDGIGLAVPDVGIEGGTDSTGIAGENVILLKAVCVATAPTNCCAGTAGLGDVAWTMLGGEVEI